MTIEELSDLQAAMPTPELIAKARAYIKNVSKKGERQWRMTIPVNKNDADMILSEVCRRLEHLEKLTWLSPVPAERESQEAKIRAIWPGYPNICPDFQILNGLLAIAAEYRVLKDEQSMQNALAERFQ